MNILTEWLLTTRVITMVLDKHIAKTYIAYYVL